MEHSPATLTVAALLSRDEAPCILRDEGDLSYREVRDLVSRYLQALQLAGVGPKSIVGLLGSNSTEMILVMAALTLSAATRVPLNARGSLSDHGYLVADAGVNVLVYDASEFSERAARIAEQAVGIKLVPYGDHRAGSLAAASEEFHPEPLSTESLPGHLPSDLALIGYTGGTTGRPKGVRSPNSVQAWMTIIQLIEWDWPVEVRSTIVVPLSHSGMVVSLATWLKGGAVHVLEGKLTAERFFDAVARHRITTTLVVPTIVYSWLDSPRLDTANLSSLETVFYGSAPMSPTRLAEAIRRIGPVFSQFYGQSEAPMTVCTMPKRFHDVESLERLASCGRPVPWVEVTLRNESGEVEDGLPGEICVRGPLLMDGYQNLPAETAAVLEGGWLHTGDIAIKDEAGFLTIVDRKKDVIITGGFNVYPREVEMVIELIDGVAQVAVIGVPDNHWGEAVHALIVTHQGVEVTAAGVIEHVRALKGAVQAPKSVEFVSSLPHSAVGKIDKRALRLQYIGVGA